MVLWPQVKPLIARVLDLDRAGRYQPIDVLQYLLSGRTRLWVSWNPDEKEVEGIAVTEIVEFPRAKECRIWLVAGRNMRAWAYEGRDMVEAFARAQGCTVMTGAFRRGWLRIGGEGWREAGVALEKVL